MILDVVPKVVEIATHLITEDSVNHDGAPIALSNLCQLHDELIETCQHQQQSSGEVLSRISLLYLLAQDQKQQVTDLITLEADLYRAVVGLSLYLLRTIPNSTVGVSSIQGTLQDTIRQSFLLLTILDKQYSLATGVEDDTAPTQYSVLVQWIDSQKEYWVDEPSSTILTFDRHDLAMEEFQLLQMANTPTPWEDTNEGQSSIPVERKEMLVAQLSSSVIHENDDPCPPRMIQVQWTSSCGMIRWLDPEVEDTRSRWWAALTAASTIHFHPPTLTITSVLVPTMIPFPSESDSANPSTLGICSLELHVGQQGGKWRVVTSRVIEQLQELEELYEDVRSLWPDETITSTTAPSGLQA